MEFKLVWEHQDIANLSGVAKGYGTIKLYTWR
jgi:hypothetical protein